MLEIDVDLFLIFTIMVLDRLIIRIAAIKTKHDSACCKLTRVMREAAFNIHGPSFGGNVHLDI